MVIEFYNIKFGSSVSISYDGNTIAVGGPQNYGGLGFDFSGATWVFRRTLSGWVQQGLKIVGGPVEQFTRQGHSVALSGNGNVLAVTGYTDISSGVYVFNYNGVLWLEYDGSPFKSNTTSPFSMRYESVSLSEDGLTLVSGDSNRSVVDVFNYEETDVNN